MHKSILLVDRSSVGESRRAAVAAAQALGFEEERRSDIGIVATEAATNALMHATGGELLICPFNSHPDVHLDLIAIDNGPGIRDIARAHEDGYSTLGTAGQGLGAIQRLADSSSLYSTPGQGVVLWSRFVGPQFTTPPPAGVVSIPFHGETVSGDAWLVLPGPSRSLYMVVDGLGHGPGAHEAALEAVAVVQQYPDESPAFILARAHDALRKTRGGAMSIAVVHHDRLTVTYAGVGNISASLTASGNQSRSMVSQNGTLGAVLPRINEYNYPFDPSTILLMFSDGLNTKCSLGPYPGLQNRDPQLIAALLYRDFSRRRDDATVLVSRLAGSRA